MNLTDVTNWLFQRGAYAKAAPTQSNGPSFYEKLDPSLQGNVEDRTKMSPQDLSDAEMFSLLGTFQPKPEEEYQGNIANQAGLMDIAKQDLAQRLNDKFGSGTGF